MKKGKRQESIEKLKDELLLARSQGNGQRVKALEKLLKRLEKS